MNRPTIDVRNAQRALKIDLPMLRCCAATALSVLGLAEAELSVVVVSDRRMKQLNSRYRGHDTPTDVLSFSQREGKGKRVCKGLLGDVVLSAETAKRQADARKPVAGLDSLGRELAVLLVHGIAHLAGYDHHDEASRSKMRAVERRILDEVRNAAKPVW